MKFIYTRHEKPDTNFAIGDTRLFNLRLHQPDEQNKRKHILAIHIYENNNKK